jgi:hypothetical protein
MPMVFEGSVTPLGEASAEGTTESGERLPSRSSPEEAAAPAADPPTARTVAIQTGQSDKVEERQSTPCPPVSGGVDDLPLPPGLDGVLDEATDEPTAEPPPQSMASCDPDADAPLPEDPGDACLEWIRRGVADGSLLVNTREARIHVVPEGVLLVSPGIFRDFGSATGHAWNVTQKRFQRLQLHEKSSEGTNIHRYVVQGERQTSRINGLLIRDISTVFGPDWTPPPNDHLTPTAEA